VFFGRYTDEETSNTNFLFPGALPTVGGTPTSPMASGATLGLDSNNYTMWLLNGTPPTAPSAELPFGGGTRRGEDILLTNVVSFDVKLWDNHYSEVAAGYDVNRNGIIDTGAAFADIGNVASGDFQQSKNAFPVYGPRVSSADSFPGNGVWAPAYTYTSNGVIYNYNNVFDTWFRQFDFDNLSRTYDANAADTNLYAPAPYRPRLNISWQANVQYTVGALVDPINNAYPINTANGYVYRCVTAGTSGAPAWTANTAYAVGAMVQPSPPNGVVYVAIQPGTSAAGQPGFTTTTGATYPDGTTLVWMEQPVPFSLSDQVVPSPPTSYITDGTVQWQAQAPLNVQAIQITVKYLDPTQNLLRQVTIVQSLTQ
jgi:hypothetical protein